MELTSLFSAVEASQTAKANGTSQLTADQAKLVALNAAIDADTSNVADLTTKADADILSAITALQGLLSTATGTTVN